MTIEWVTGIPANTPATDQPDMLANNDAVPTYVAIDHVGFGVANAGYHSQVHMNTNFVASPGIGAGVGVLYANVGSAISQLFWDNGTTNTQISPNGTFSGRFDVTSPNPPTSSGSLILGPIIIKWGWQAQALNGVINGTVNFPVAFPNALYAVYTSLTSLNSQPGTNTTQSCIAVGTDDTVTSKAKFKYFVNSATTQYTGFMWLAIGN